jgi:DNA-binding transcriptional LysR family regulator
MTKPTFDLRLLRVFDVLMAERNVTQAATRLHLTQSAVSQALAKLRDAVGDPLFIRSRHGMVPTAKALAMAAPLRQALDIMAATLEATVAFEPGKSRRSFRIATTDYTLMELLPKLVKKVQERAPNIELIVSPIILDRGFESIRDDRIDLVIAYFVVTKVPSNFRKRQLFRDSYVVLARKGHAKFRAGMTLSAYAEAEHIVVTPRDTWQPWPLDAALGKSHLKRNIRVRVPHFLLVPYVVADTDLIATIPARAAAYIKDKFPIDIFSVPLDVSTFKVEMTWDERHHHDPAHRWMRNLLSEVGRTL